ncbi:dTMP kinase [Campylobacter cuniculorum]|uniref:dTMP kinase n=1 Tax=Campylobacter cuniculorum TaxID=374106 RepID=UPI0023F03EF5|nr:dTMP kinase [Campylobacter cuniculorum]
MYVAIEGIDCMGKSTQIALLKEKFKDAIFTQEPGATELGKHLRELLLLKPYTMSKKSEFLLFLADRSQHYEEILSQNKNKLIISDRSFISGMAYAKDFDKNFLFELNDFALNHFFPEKIIFLQGSKELIEKRLSQKKLDDIEQRGVKYFLEIQKELKIVLELIEKKIKTRILSLNAQDSKENLHKQIKDFIDD